MRNVIEALERNYAERKAAGTREIEVPEFGRSGDGAFTIYVNPISAEEYQSIIKEPDLVARNAQTVVARARSKAGKLLFNRAFRDDLLKFIDPERLAMIADEINADVAHRMAVDRPAGETALANAEERYLAQLQGAEHTVEVPEFGTEDAPATITVRPITTEEYRAIIRHEDAIEQGVETIVQRSRTVDGTRMFGADAATRLKRTLTPDVVLRIARDINADMDGLFSGDWYDSVKK